MFPCMQVDSQLADTPSWDAAHGFLKQIQEQILENEEEWNKLADPEMHVDVM
jgi:hypothetical protein